MGENEKEIEECTRLLKIEEAYSDRIGNIVGVPFAVIAGPSWVLAFFGFFVFGPIGFLIAIPGFIAFAVAVLVFWGLTRNSDKRSHELLLRILELKR